MIEYEKFEDFDVYSEKSERQFRYIYINQQNFYEKLCQFLLTPETLHLHATLNIDANIELTKENYREIYNRLIQFIDFEKVINIDETLDPAIKAILDAELFSPTADLRRDKWGRIGEYIFNIILDSYFKLDCVIRKFALNTSPNMPIYGIDTVHCSIENKKMYFGESKCVTNISNGVKLINESLANYEAQIAKEYFTLSNTNFKQNPKFSSTYGTYMDTCLTFYEFLSELDMKFIGVPIFIAHAGKFDVESVFEQLRNINRKNLFGLETEYIAISFPLVDKDKFREKFIEEANNQLEIIAACRKK